MKACDICVPTSILSPTENASASMFAFLFLRVSVPNSLQDLIIVECSTTNKGTLAGLLTARLLGHASPTGFASLEQTLKLPTGDFIPDVVAWAQRPTDQQREAIALTPLSNLWVEVCCLMTSVKISIALVDLLQ